MLKTLRVVNNAQSREEALIALHEKAHEVFSREHKVNPEPRRVKFSEFAEQCLENYAKVNKATKSWKTDGYYLKGMREFFAGLYLDEIPALDIEKYKAERLKHGVRPATVNRCLAILRKMFNLRSLKT